jgi:hypothetical protein
MSAHRRDRPQHRAKRHAKLTAYRGKRRAPDHVQHGTVDLVRDRLQAERGADQGRHQVTGWR